MDTGVNVPSRPVTVSAEVLDEWLRYASMDLTERLKELTRVMFRLSTEHPTVDDEETAGIFTENLRMIAALRKSVEDFHKKEKAPYWNLGKRVDAWLHDFASAIDGMDDALRPILKKYINRRDSAKIFDDKQPVRGHYGGTASLKETWGYVVEDITKVPVEYLTVDDRLVREVLADRNPKTRVPKRKIPGIRWVKNKQLAVS